MQGCLFATDGFLSLCGDVQVANHYMFRSDLLFELQQSLPRYQDQHTCSRCSHNEPHRESALLKNPLTTYCVEAFQFTAFNRDNNVDWPEWAHKAWNKHENELGSISLVPNPEFPRQMHVRLTQHDVMAIPQAGWVVYHHNDAGGTLTVLEDERFNYTYVRCNVELEQAMAQDSEKSTPAEPEWPMMTPIVAKMLHEEINRQGGLHGTHKHTIPEWLLILERTLLQAKEEWYKRSDRYAVPELLKLAAATVTALEQSPFMVTCPEDVRVPCIERKPTTGDGATLVVVPAGTPIDLMDARNHRT